MAGIRGLSAWDAAARTLRFSGKWGRGTREAAGPAGVRRPAPRVLVLGRLRGVQVSENMRARAARTLRFSERGGREGLLAGKPAGWESRNPRLLRLQPRKEPGAQRTCGLEPPGLSGSRASGPWDPRGRRTCGSQASGPAGSQLGRPQGAQVSENMRAAAARTLRFSERGGREGLLAGKPAGWESGDPQALSLGGPKEPGSPRTCGLQLPGPSGSPSEGAARGSWRENLRAGSRETRGFFAWSPARSPGLREHAGGSWVDPQVLGPDSPRIQPPGKPAGRGSRIPQVLRTRLPRGTLLQEPAGVSRPGKRALGRSGYQVPQAPRARTRVGGSPGAERKGLPRPGSGLF